MLFKYQIPIPKLSKKQIIAAVDEALKDEEVTSEERREIVNDLLSIMKTKKGRRIKKNPRHYDHYPIRDKRDFDPDSFRTITLDPERNIKGVIACRKGYWNPRKGRCMKGTELQKFLYPIGTEPKTVLENPAKEQLQSIADTLQCPVGVIKELDKEIKMYERFHKKEPDALIRASHPEIPKSLVALGRLESVVYRKNGQSYIHDLKHGILAADRKGKLYIIGDKARITKRGIVG